MSAAGNLVPEVQPARSADVMLAGVADRRGPVPGSGFGEDPVDMGLDRVVAQVQAPGDLRIGLAVEHEHGELELASGQRLERRSGGPARPRALLDSMAELAKLPLRLAAIAEGAGLPEVVGRTPKLAQLMSQITRYAPESVFPAVDGWPKRSMRASILPRSRR